MIILDLKQTYRIRLEVNDGGNLGMEGLTEIRWLVLGTDGRHVTVGRHSDPDPSELAHVAGLLREKNLSGWLVLMKGGYYVQRKPELMLVRPLCEPADCWDEAVAAFDANWREAAQAGKRLRMKSGS
jgi:hypothetical protein